MKKIEKTFLWATTTGSPRTKICERCEKEVPAPNTPICIYCEVLEFEEDLLDRPRFNHGFPCERLPWGVPCERLPWGVLRSLIHQVDVELKLILECLKVLFVQRGEENEKNN